jgi:hypothetical protein
VRGWATGGQKRGNSSPNKISGKNPEFDLAPIDCPIQKKIPKKNSTKFSSHSLICPSFLFSSNLYRFHEQR